jgi:uncharacterized protein YbjT (DUF2867 family)
MATASRTNLTTPTTLVIGGTGKTGRRVVERLTRQGMPVRAGSRSSQPPFDWNDRATWEPALAGVDQAYITYYPDVAVPGAADAVAALTDLALRQGVQRLVLLTGRGEPEAEIAEQAMIASGADWTIVRASWFNQNFSENVFLEPLRHGTLALPAGTVGEPFVDADDIADVVTAALTEEGHVGQLYELTGPRLLSLSDAVAEIAAATGRDIEYVPITIEEFAAGLASEGVPEEFASLLTYLFSEVLDGRNGSLTDGVQRALGRPPRDFSDYVRATAATGIWDEPVGESDQPAAGVAA